MTSYKRHKVLYVVSTLKKSGPTNQLFNIISNLDRSRFEPFIVTLSPEPLGSSLPYFENLGIEIFQINLSRFKGVFFGGREFKKILKEVKPDVIHSQGVRGDLMSARFATAFSCPNVATVRNFPQVDYPLTYGKIIGGFLLFLQQKALKNINLVVAVSDSVASNLATSFQIDVVSVVRNGVDTKRYKSVSKKEKNSLRSRLNLPAQGRLWVMSGHLSARKNPLFVMKLWETHLKMGKDFLILIGDGNQSKLCQSIAERVANVRVIGRVDNVHDYLNASDYYVTASVAEGLPNAVLEAMACGLPVLMSDIPPHKEIYNLDHGVGEVFGLDNESEFLFKFNRLLSVSYEDFSKSSLNLISSKLSAEIMSNNYQKLYLDLIKK